MLKGSIYMPEVKKGSWRLLETTSDTLKSYKHIVKKYRIFHMS